MQSELDTRVKSYIEAYRKHEKASEGINELIRQDAWAVAMEIKCLVSRQAKLWRRIFYERYDFDVRRWVDKDPMDWPSLPQGRNPRETAKIVEDALAYTFWERARRLTLVLERVAIEAGVDRDLVVCTGLLFLGRRDREPVDWLGDCSDLPQALKMELLIEQAGWVGSQVSLDRNRRLYTALVGWGTSPFENLIRELPGAVLAAYGEQIDDARDRRSFVTQVTRVLEVLGSETAGRSDKLTTFGSEVPFEASEDEEAAQFERKETLDTIERAAKLSPQQAAVLGRLRQGKGIPEIAVDLGITENQVSVQKNKAIHKLSKARTVPDLS